MSSRPIHVTLVTLGVADVQEEVDDALDRAVAAGAKLVKPAEKVFWGGYSGYFSDPDDHLWEVAHNPFSPLRDDGSMEL